MADRQMSPKLLDYLLSGVPVRIYQRPSDKAFYASIHDYSQFGVKAVETIRVPLTPDLPAECETWPKVKAALEKHRAK